MLNKYKEYASAIKIDDNEIAFDEIVYPLSDIQFVCLTGKPPLGEHTTTLEEAAVIKFRNGDLQYIFDNVHDNAWELKLALEQVIIRNEPIQITKIEKASDRKASLENSQKFAASQWKSFSSLFLWGFIILFLLMAVSLTDELGLLGSSIILFTALGFYMLLVHLTHYFAITKDKHLVILNHAFPFKQQEIRLSDIREAVFEARHRSSYILRIITNDFRSKSFTASTLRNRKWFELKIALEKHGIFVRNECVQDFDLDLETIEKTSYE